MMVVVRHYDMYVFDGEQSEADFRLRDNFYWDKLPLVGIMTDLA